VERLPYFIMAGALIVSLGAALVGGGKYWIVPAAIWPIILVYFLFDRRLKQREGGGERAAAEGG
jgi:hypothetical protein